MLKNLQKGESLTYICIVIRKSDFGKPKINDIIN